MPVNTSVIPIPTPLVPTPAPTPRPETRLALEHIAARENIPVERLLVAVEQPWNFPTLGKTYWAVRVLDIQGGKWYDTLLDLQTNGFEDDLKAPEQAEYHARREKYGKLEPVLYERLSTMAPEEQVPVAIWMTGERRNYYELVDVVAAKYPQVRAALERSGNPFDLDDYDLINEVERAYIDLLTEDVQKFVQPLVDELGGRGYSVTTFGGLPVIVATLSKSAVMDIASRSDVAEIYLSDGKPEKLLDSTAFSNRAFATWHEGIKGDGVEIGILEEGKVNFNWPGYLRQGIARACNEPTDEHKTWVATTAASSHPTYTGMAPDATIVDVCVAGDTDEEVVAVLSQVWLGLFMKKLSIIALVLAISSILTGRTKPSIIGLGMGMTQ